MDNITHALAGGLLAAGAITVAKRRGLVTPDHFAKTATFVGVVTAELPDVDLLYAGPALGMGKLGYLLHHRGYTHTLVFALVAAIVVWLVMLALKCDTRARGVSRLLLALALVGAFSHLALDYTNNYGVHLFWPVLNGWYYGDAVFIVEPWLWIVSVPVLFSTYTSRAARITLGALLTIILTAALFTGFVERAVVIALFVGTGAVAAAIWKMPARVRAIAGIVAWVLVEGVFLTASSRARRAVESEAGTTLLDVALTPNVSNPLCYSGLVVDADSITVRVRAAIVAAFPRLRDAEACAEAGPSLRTSLAPMTSAGAPNTLVQTRNSVNVQWMESEFRAPVGELAQLARANCVERAALEFIRIPVWRVLPDSTIDLADARFGAARGSFAAVSAAPHPAKCPRFVPGWTPPRSDLLRLGAKP